MIETLTHLLNMGSVRSTTENLVIMLAQQVIVMLLFAQLVVWLAKKFLGQTAVSGEILSGLLLGPSCFGALFPAAFNAIFPGNTSSILGVLSQIALVFLMFEVGLSFEFGKAMGDIRRSLAAVAFGGIAVPFVWGYASGPWFWSHLDGVRPQLLGFRLFFAVSMSITAIPILGRIFMELRLAHTRVAILVMSAAAINDLIGWLLLGIAGALVQAAFSPAALLLRLALLTAYFAVVWFVARPALKFAIAANLRRPEPMNASAVALVAAMLFGSAAVTAHLGVFPILGGFCLGVALHDDRAFVEKWRARTAVFVRAILLPIFFTFTGLRTDIGSIHGAQDWMAFGLVLVIAFVGKFGGSFIAARLAGESLHDATTIGVCMNTRALMELVVINIGYDLGVLPKSIFTMLVIMAIGSTFITSPLVRMLTRSYARPPRPIESISEELIHLSE